MNLSRATATSASESNNFIATSKLLIRTSARPPRDERKHEDHNYTTSESCGRRESNIPFIKRPLCLSRAAAKSFNKPRQDAKNRQCRGGKGRARAPTRHISPLTDPITSRRQMRSSGHRREIPRERRLRIFTETSGRRCGRRE